MSKILSLIIHQDDNAEKLIALSHSDNAGKNYYVKEIQLCTNNSNFILKTEREMAILGDGDTINVKNCQIKVGIADENTLVHKNRSELQEHSTLSHEWQHAGIDDISTTKLVDSNRSSPYTEHGDEDDLSFLRSHESNQPNNNNVSLSSGHIQSAYITLPKTEHAIASNVHKMVIGNANEYKANEYSDHNGETMRDVMTRSNQLGPFKLEESAKKTWLQKIKDIANS